MRGYGKIYTLGHKYVKDIFRDPVEVTEKIDGSQFNFGISDGELKCRSRKADAYDSPNFDLGVATAERLFKAGLLEEGWIYRGEYLRAPKHNAITYDRVPAGNVILYDVDRGDQDYIPHAELAALARVLDLECVPLLFEGIVLKMESLQELLQEESILGGPTEGIVIKNYDRMLPDGKTMMAKLVKDEFKEVNKAVWASPKKHDVVDSIAKRYCNENRWLKSVQRLRELGVLENAPRDIGALIREVRQDIYEECRDEIAGMLFEAFWGRISKNLTKGLPEWYKARITEEIEFYGKQNTRREG